jgi:hypothetical protein
MPRKKTNKSQAIRDYAKANPKATVNEIATKLKVSYTLAYQVLNRKGKKKKRPASSKGHEGNGQLTLESLVAAKALVVKLGSIETAKAILVALEKLK